MTDAITLVLAGRDDVVAQLLADGYEALPARTAAETHCPAGRGPELLLLGELGDATALGCCASSARAPRWPRGPTRGCR